MARRKLQRNFQSVYFVALVRGDRDHYFDRQTLPVAISAITRTIHISDAQFGCCRRRFSRPMR